MNLLLSLRLYCLILRYKVRSKSPPLAAFCVYHQTYQGPFDQFNFFIDQAQIFNLNGMVPKLLTLVVADDGHLAR